jgi:hypothetical protein
MPSATASPEETNEHVRSAPMEFEVAHSLFPESRVLASYPSSQGTNAIFKCALLQILRHPCLRWRIP